MKTDKVAIIIRDQNNYWEGLRSGLGLGLEMILTDTFVLGEVEMHDDRIEGYKENLEFLKEELDGNHYTDNLENVKKWDLFEYMSVDEMRNKLCEYDLIIPF